MAMKSAVVPAMVREPLSVVMLGGVPVLRVRVSDAMLADGIGPVGPGQW
jgi:hypothetical protein